MTYNGWRNYETWVTKLWIDNDQSEEEYWLEEAERYSKASDLAERLKDYHQDLMPALVAFAPTASLIGHVVLLLQIP